MNEYGWVAIVASLGWLVLAIGAFRAQRVGASKMAVMAFVWVGIFLLVAVVFAAVGA